MIGERRMTRLTTIFLLLALSFLLLGYPTSEVQAERGGEQLVYVVELNQPIERALLIYLQRAFADAKEANADAIIMEITTPGGRVDVAGQIGELIRSSQVPVTAYIKGEAFSAGTYLALNATHLLMAPGSTMGAATPIYLTGNMADAKVMAAWKAKMTSAAEMNDRDPIYAAAMVDPEVEIPGISKQGEVLTLNPGMAQEVGYADGVAQSIDEVLAWLDLTDASIEEIRPSFADQLANWITNPIVASILLVLGILGIVVELLVPGFGIAGGIGAVSMLLYFFGHYLAGFAGMETIILFIIGVILLLIEIFVPGFGIFGGLGLISLLISIVLAAASSAQGLLYLGIAMAVTIFASLVLIRIYGVRKLWNRFILQDEQKNDEGYVSAKRRDDLLHQEGVTITPLRPAGVILIQGERVDVVSEGEFIAANQQVEVIHVDGGRIIVRPTRKKNED